VAWFSKREEWVNSRQLEDSVRQHYSDVFRFCSRFVGADTAEDMVQETFVTAHRRMKEFAGRSSMKTWLFSIALNHCRNDKRKKKPLPLEDWHTTQTVDGSNSLIEAEAIRTALAQLTSEHREVVILHESQGLNYEECAQVLGIPSGTVKSRLYYAFKKLRELLDTDGEMK